jgi:hypothetical protein
MMFDVILAESIKLAGDGGDLVEVRPAAGWKRLSMDGSVSGPTSVDIWESECGVHLPDPANRDRGQREGRSRLVCPEQGILRIVEATPDR